MNDWDKVVYGMVFIAFVAVIVASKQTSGAVTGVGQAITKLTQNIVGVPKQAGA